jgi:hypothetical protein
MSTGKDPWWYSNQGKTSVLREGLRLDETSRVWLETALVSLETVLAWLIGNPDNSRNLVCDLLDHLE